MPLIHLPQKTFTRGQADSLAQRIRKRYPGAYCTTFVLPVIGPVYRITV